MSTDDDITVTVTKDRFNEIFKSLKKLSTKDVLIGVPQEKTGREVAKELGVKKSMVTNAELMFIHTNGSELLNIPKRPTIEPTIEQNQEAIARKIKKIAMDAIDNNNDNSDAELEKIGIWLVNKVRAKFGSDELAPNSPYTIKQKGSDRPLIDTGQLRNSVTYVIRRDNGN